VGDSGARAQPFFLASHLPRISRSCRGVSAVQVGVICKLDLHPVAPSSIVRQPTRTRPMQMRYANIETPSSTATDVATRASCPLKPSGFLRPDENHALAGGCSR